MADTAIEATQANEVIDAVEADDVDKVAEADEANLIVEIVSVNEACVANQAIKPMRLMRPTWPTEAI